MNILFLDDDDARQREFRSRFPSADIVSTAEDCICRLRAWPYDIVCLDHDLGGEQYADSSGKNTGMEVVRWLENPTTFNLDSTLLVVHSMNAPAAMAMAERIADGGYRIRRIPFGKELFEAVESMMQEEASV